MQDDVRKSIAGAGGAMNADLRAFQAHWAEARRGDSVPYRAHIDPRRIAPLLPNVFVAERIAPGVTRMRIAGMHLSHLVGTEARGIPLCSLIAPAARDAFALALVELFDRPATLRMDLRSHGGLGGPELRGTLLMMPLRSDLGDVSRVLGCLVTNGEAGRTPCRFEIASTQVTPVVEDPEVTAPRVVPGGRRVRPHPRATPCTRAHLRLVGEA